MKGKKIIISVVALLLAGGLATAGGIVGKQIVDARQKNSELVSENQSKQDEIDKYQQQIVENEHKIGQLEGNIKEINSQVRGLEGELKKSADNIVQLNEQLSAKQNELNSSQEQMASLRETEVQLNQQIAECEAEIESLNQNAAENQSEIARLQNNISSLESEKQNLQNSIGELETQADEQTATINALNAAISSLESTKSQNEASIAALQEQVENLESTIESLNTQIQELSIVVENYKQAVGELAEVKFYNKATGDLLKVAFVKPSETYYSNKPNSAQLDIASIFSMPGYRVDKTYINGKWLEPFKIKEDMSIYVELVITPSGGFEIQEGQSLERSGVFDLSQTGLGNRNIYYNLTYVEKLNNQETFRYSTTTMSNMGRNNEFYIIKKQDSNSFDYKLQMPENMAYIKITLTTNSIVYESHSYTHENGQIDYFSEFSIDHIA